MKCVLTCVLTCQVCHFHICSFSWHLRAATKCSMYSKSECLQIGRQVNTHQGLGEIPSKSECLQIGRQVDTNQGLVEIPSKSLNNLLCWSMLRWSNWSMCAQSDCQPSGGHRCQPRTRLFWPRAVAVALYRCGGRGSLRAFGQTFFF